MNSWPLRRVSVARVVEENRRDFFLTLSSFGSSRCQDPGTTPTSAKGLLDAYPRSAKPDTSVAYVMWPDTPYEHMMIPVR
jgi:hypothetical protein